MAKEVFYRQCHLQKKTATGTLEQTSYIPEPYCVMGKVIKLRDQNDVWDDGWKVVFVSENKHSEEWTNLQSRGYTKNRKATDI